MSHIFPYPATVNRREIQTQPKKLSSRHKISLALIETTGGVSVPAHSNAKTLSRVHLQDRFVALCVPLVLARKGRSALRPGGLRASVTDGLRAAPGFTTKEAGRPAAALAASLAKRGKIASTGEGSRVFSTPARGRSNFTRLVHTVCSHASTLRCGSKM